MRSLLFVPGDSEKKLAGALSSGADALILDLEDSVAAARKEVARALSAEFIARELSNPHRPKFIVRINALDTGLTDDDLAAIVPSGPDGILLPKASHGSDIEDLAVRLSVLEAKNGLKVEQTKIQALITETAAAMFTTGTYGNRSARLSGLAWGAEDLAADIGAFSNRREDGTYTDTFRLARSLTLLGAAAAQIDAIDTVYTDFRNPDGLKCECQAAVRDGFSAKMAIHPAQVDTINDAFTPSATDLDWANRVIDLFSNAGEDAGVLSLDGKMIDRPHLRQAQRLLSRSQYTST